MAYRIEGKDIVISGFEEGISESPYSGLADMRNMEIITMPGEASVMLGTSSITAPPVKNAVAYTAQNTGDTITPTGGTAGFYQGVAIVLASNTATGLSNGIVYYVFNITATTFQLSIAPASTTPVAITADGTGTFTTYQYGNQRGTSTTVPASYWVDKTGALAGTNAVFLTDGSNYAWAILPSAQVAIPANSLIFLGNIGGNGAGSITGASICVWNGYILIFGSVVQGIDIGDAGDVWISTGPAVAWDYAWENESTQITNGRIPLLVSQEDGNLYFASNDGLGSIIETPGDSFDPTDANSYTITDEALIIPESDETTCLAELGQNILIGARGSFVYVWNKIDPGFSNLLNVPDNFTSNIVATSQNAYVFSGIRGRIYITNGSGIDLYKKFPDYLTGTVNPKIRWQDASFGRNQLYFTLTATGPTGTTLTTVNGVWAIDLETDALRMVNKTSISGYAGTTRMAVERAAANSSNPASSDVVGANLIIGGNSSGSYPIDYSSSAPYTNYESYMHTEIIPVGTFLDPFTPSQIEWKASAPLVSGEAVRLSYRTNIVEGFTIIGTTTTAGVISDLYQTNFEKAQWVQFLVETKSTATTPSYTRATEIRIRDWPSGKNSNVKT